MKFSLLIIGCAGSMFLAGCASTSSETAFDLMQQQQQKQDLARQHEAEQVRKEASSEPQLMLSMIREAQGQGRYFASLAYIDAYIKKFGRSSSVDILQADALRMTGQAAPSESLYRALLKTDQASEGWHGLALLAGAKGDFKQAADYLERASASAPANALVLNDLAYARLRAGNIQAARVPIGMAAELEPENKKILSNLALYLLATGDAVQADSVMTRAGLSPQTREQIYRLANNIAIPAPSQAMQTTHPSNGLAPVIVRPMQSYFGNQPLVR